MDDFLTSEAIAVSPDLMVNRLETLNLILNNQKNIVVTNLMGYLRFLPSKNLYQKSHFTFSIDDEIEPKKLVEKLYHIGYTKESIVTKTGEFSVRGFVIDVFPLGLDHPVRFEFFGDSIESIRSFDEDTQKSLESLKSVSIDPYTEFILEKYPEEYESKQKHLLELSNSVSNIYQYLDPTIVIYKDYPQLEKSYELLVKEIFEYRQEKDQAFFLLMKILN